MVVVVVAGSTGCNGSASRLTRRTRLDLSTYRKHRERGGQETPTISYRLVFRFPFSFCRNGYLDLLVGVLTVTVLRENWFRVGDAKDERNKRQVEVERKAAGKSLRSLRSIDSAISAGALFFSIPFFPLLTDNVREIPPCALPL